MSKYTDLEHKSALEQTIYWDSTSIDTPEKEYEYGRYLERLKDYEEAMVYYERAWKNGSMPAAYLYLKGMSRQQETIREEKQAEELRKTVFSYYREKKESAEDYYRLGTLYKEGIGVKKEMDQAIQCFYTAAEDNFGGAFYELGIVCLEGLGGCEKDYLTARKYLRKAYDAHWEEAIFKDFEIFQGQFSEYEYQREIMEAYSFRLGQLIRAAELRKTAECYQRVIEMYQKGFPGDTGKKRELFIRKADKYRN
ncbi:tetratricopeptide repeat protein [Anaeromicropila populeti]|nr:SEL1-like repeat protein [Anaeromicropila populeti]